MKLIKRTMFHSYTAIKWALIQENLSKWFPTRSCSNQPAQLQKLVRILKAGLCLCCLLETFLLHAENI